MKKIYIAALFLFVGSLVAQNSFGIFKLGTTDYLIPDVIIKASTTPLTKSTIQFDIRNTSNVSHTYAVKRYDRVLNKTSGDEAYALFCFGGNCFPTETKTSDPVTLKPGQTAAEAGIEIDPDNDYFHLDADLVEASAIGISDIRYTFYDVNNKADSIQFAIRYNDPFVGIKETAKKTSRLEMFPNPGTDFTTITLESSNDQGGQLKVFSSIGTVVFEKHIVSLEGKHTYDLNLQNLAAGVYFVQLKEAHATTTKKLVVGK